MTADRLTEILTALHWSIRGLAVVLGEHETTVRRWVKGDAAIPVNVAEWLTARSAIAFKRPLPDGWVPRVNYRSRTKQ
jgi:hypothetical protein